MGESGRDFLRDYEAAVIAEEATRKRLDEATGLASQLILRGLVAYRRLDTALLQDLAGKPEPIEEPRVDYAETWNR